MKKRKTKNPARGAWLLLPSLAGVTVFMLYPLGKTVFQSFFSRLSGGRFVGLKNYSELLSNGAFSVVFILPPLLLYAGAADGLEEFAGEQYLKMR